MATCLVSATGLASQDWKAASTVSSGTGGFVAGHEADGNPVYIMRAPFEGGLVPGKFMPASRSAYVSWGGREHSVRDFEVFTGRAEWRSHRKGSPLPPDAIPGGREADGRRLFIIRSPMGGGLVPGKLNEATGQAYIPWGGKEVEVQNYELLVAIAEPEWIPADTTNPATAAAPAGVSPDGTPSFLIRALFQGSLIPGKYNPKAKAAYVPWGGKENKVATFELYTGSGVWVPGDPAAPPPNAVEVGREADGTTLLAIRSRVDKALVPGKYNVKTKTAYVSLGGKEIQVTRIEYLTRNSPAPVIPPAQANQPAPAVQPPPGPTSPQSLEAVLFKLAGTKAPREARVRGGSLALTGELGKDDHLVDSYRVDMFRLILDKDANFNLVIAGVAPAADYSVHLLDQRGQALVQPVLLDDYRRAFHVNIAVNEALYFFVVQNGPKAVGRYGFDLLETSYVIEGELEGVAFSQESLVPMVWTTDPPVITVGGNAAESGFVPLIDALDASGKVIARSELVDPVDGVSQLSFRPAQRGQGSIRIYPASPAPVTRWKLQVFLDHGGGQK